MDQNEEQEKPDWWEANKQLKNELGLPPYRPPRFLDDVYTFEVVGPLESKYNCNIRFSVTNPGYPDDWEVRVNQKPIMEIGKYRDKNGNTIFEITSTEFENKLKNVLENP